MSDSTDPTPSASPPATGSRPSEPAGADLDARYGRSGTSRRPVIIGVVAVIVAVGLAWLVWAALVGSNPPVTSRLIGFEITSPTSAKATVEIDKRESTEASCRLQAKAADFSIVGELTVTVPADSPRHQTLTPTLTTQRPATSVVLIGCTTPDSPRPH
ncbi:DUF4307 domain-containing protein [Kribbella sp. CA-247076]|uniref:DUF4307 domain-containing protein n=1 Tax=Kribbella sp. CA-247076 TaxID=3239941 RepID=UPI003D9499F8